MPDGSLTAPAVRTTHKSTGRVLGNWLMEYLEYTADNEAPRPYHEWIGLGTIAGAAQRKVYMETRYFFVHSNMYIVLVGPPGTKKSTALRIGKSMLKKVPGTNFTTNATSVSALIQQFTQIPTREHQSLTAFSSELGSLLGISKVDMVDFLVDIFDGEPDWDKQTRMNGKEKIPHPWLNIMAGTTPQWMGDNLSRTAVEGGFVSRSLFVYSDEIILTSPFTPITPTSVQAHKNLVNDLAHISTLNGEFGFTEAAQKWYDDWYLDRSRFPTMMDNRLGGYYMRKHVHLLKVAMALRMSESDKMILEIQDVQTALAFLEGIEERMPEAFATVGGNLTASDMKRILSQIQERGKMAYGEVLARNLAHVRKDIIDELLGNLVDMGEIKRVVGMKSTTYEAV